MAIVVSNVQVLPSGGMGRISLFSLAFDSSYPTGGESLTPSQVGLQTITHFIPGGGNGYRLQYDIANEKVMSYTSAGTQTSNATDLSALTAVQCIAYGT